MTIGLGIREAIDDGGHFDFDTASPWSPDLGVRARGGGGAFRPSPKPPRITLRNARFIAAAHDVTDRMAPLEPTSAPVMMSRSLLEHEPRRGSGPAGVTVEHGDDDGHVRPADRHDDVNADQPTR